MNLIQRLKTTDMTGRLSDLFRSMRLNAIEIVFLVAAIIFAAIVFFFYLTQVRPLNSDITALDNRQKDLQTKVNQGLKDDKKKADQTSNSSKILESLGRFESYLKPDGRGTTQIINEVDSLGKTHKVIVNDSTYRPTEAEALTDANGQPLPQSAIKDKKIAVYPALGIETTVIGDYTNLRRFLSDLERSKQFLIINSLSFQGEADKGAQISVKTGGKPLQTSSPESIPVSLKIEMDTYFQKAANKAGN